MIYLRVALRNLAQAKRRTLLLCLALSFVTFFLVILLALSAGLSETILRSSTVLMTGHVNVAGFYKSKPRDAFPLVTQSEQLRKDVSALISGIDFSITRGRGWGRLVSETGRMTAALAGVEAENESQLLKTLKLAPRSAYLDGGDAQLLGNLAELKEDRTAVIFAEQAKRLGLEVGDRMTILSQTTSGTQNTVDVRIVGICKDLGLMSSWTVFVAQSVIRELYQLDAHASGALMIYLDEPQKVNDVSETLRAGLSEAGYSLMEHRPAPFFQKFEQVSGEDWTGQKLDITTWEDEVTPLRWVLNALDSVSFLLITILSAIIVVGVMNSMSMAVRERSGEFGTLRAIGMRREQVLWMIIIEAVMLGLFATSLGAILGALCAYGIDFIAWEIPSRAVRMILLNDTLRMTVEWSSVAYAILGLTFASILASLIPAMRAARLQPITAIARL